MPRAMMGRLSAETLQYRGVKGYIVDGACRDIDFILKIGFPVCFTYYTPRDIVAYWRPDGFDVPIRIGIRHPRKLGVGPAAGSAEPDL